MKTIAFFGHRLIFDKEQVKDDLTKTLMEIVPQGFNRLLIGRHGDFDNLALNASLNYKKNVDKNVQINVVLTSLSPLSKDKQGYTKSDIDKNENCETLFYDIEEVYYKNRITVSNKQMIDDSDLIICYVDKKTVRSGSKRAMNYAKKQNKKIINLFKE